MSQDHWDGYLSYCSYLPAKEAAITLVQALTTRGLHASENTGSVRAVRFHDEYRRYVFSFIVNKTSLLFYVRLPALEASSTLATEARSIFSEVKVNAAGETTIRITSAKDAEAVVNWLSAKLPLPYT